MNACLIGEAGLPGGFRFLEGNRLHLGGSTLLKVIISIKLKSGTLLGYILGRGSSQFSWGLPPPLPTKKKRKAGLQEALGGEIRLIQSGISIYYSDVHTPWGLNLGMVGHIEPILTGGSGST